MTRPLSITLEGEEIPVRVRRNAQARRMVLRVCRDTGDVKLTLPKRAREASAARFLAEHLDWIDAERKKVAARPPVGDGGSLPFEGLARHIRFTGESPRRVMLTDDALVVGGPAEHAGRRLLAWLRAAAKERLSEQAEMSARALEVSYNRISIGDMRSRWGSCSARGTLRFNWRLVMAPPEVLNYVAVHEVAHLREMNHSDRFWAHVAACDPDFAHHRAWLRREGSRLFELKL
jgi:predicted metal-dependent hydrolase